MTSGSWSGMKRSQPGKRRSINRVVDLLSPGILRRSPVPTIRSGSSTTASSWFASRLMGAARSIASGTFDASSRAERAALPLRDLEHSTDVWSREEHAVGREANNADDAVIAVQEHRV